MGTQLYSPRGTSASWWSSGTSISCNCSSRSSSRTSPRSRSWRPSTRLISKSRKFRKTSMRRSRKIKSVVRSWTGSTWTRMGHPTTSACWCSPCRRRRRSSRGRQRSWRGRRLRRRRIWWSHHLEGGWLSHTCRVRGSCNHLAKIEAKKAQRTSRKQWHQNQSSSYR